MKRIARLTRFTLPLLLLIAGVTPRTGLGSTGQDVRSVGVKCNGVTNDSAAAQRAAAKPGTWYWPANATCIVGGVTSSASNVVWIGNNTTLKHLSTDTVNHMLLFRGTGVTIQGFTFDVNGVSISTSGGNATVQFLTAFTDGAATLTGNTWLNSGPTVNVGAIFLNRQSGLIEGNTIASTIQGGAGAGQVLISASRSGETLKISKNNFTGGVLNQIYLQWGSAGSDTLIADNTFTGVGQQPGNTGPTGNAIVVYSHTGTITIQGNHIYRPAFTGIRLNQTNGEMHAIVTGNVVEGAGETSIYSEFGTEGAIISNNTVRDGYNGITATNVASRAHHLPAQITGNDVSNMGTFCFHIEQDSLIGNTCTHAPIGAEVFAGYGNVLATNQFVNTTVAVVADPGLVGAPNSQVGGNVLRNVTVPPQAHQAFAMSLSTGYCISNISQANPAVVTITTRNGCPSLAAKAGEVYLIRGVYGMTQINGALCTLAKPSTNAFQCLGLDTSAYSPFAPQSACTASNVCDAVPIAQQVYASGTTPAQRLPSAIVDRQ